MYQIRSLEQAMSSFRDQAVHPIRGKVKPGLTLACIHGQLCMSAGLGNAKWGFDVRGLLSGELNEPGGGKD